MSRKWLSSSPDSQPLAECEDLITLTQLTFLQTCNRLFIAENKTPISNRVLSCLEYIYYLRVFVCVSVKGTFSCHRQIHTKGRIKYSDQSQWLSRSWQFSHLQLINEMKRLTVTNTSYTLQHNLVYTLIQCFLLKLSVKYINGNQ